MNECCIPDLDNLLYLQSNHGNMERLCKCSIYGQFKLKTSHSSDIWKATDNADNYSVQGSRMEPSITSSCIMMGTEEEQI